MNAVIPLPKEMLGTPDSSDFPQTSNVADTGIAVAVPGEAITVADGAWFLRAEYDRAGPDLHLTGPEGQQLVIRDYFNQVPPPDLMTADGVVLKGNVATQLAGPVAPAQFAQASPGGASEPIGRVETAAGQVQATRTDGTQVTLNQGDDIFAGDILETGADGTVGIVFADESTFSLGEDGRMTLDEMIYDPGSQEGSMSVNLLQGAFTFVSGQIAKTDVDAMNIVTPTSTIGIRGTAGGGHIDLEGVTTAALLPEIGFVGEMTFVNAAGSQTINLPGQAVNIASSNAPPTPPFILTAQQMGQTFGSALSALPNAAGAIQNDVIQGANEGRQQQAEAEQAAADAEAQAAEAEAKTAEAAAAAEVAQAEAEAAQAAADLAAEAAQAEGATEAELAAAEAAAELAAEASAAAAAAEAAIAEAQAELAAAAAELALAQAIVLETSAGGAVAAAAIEAGIDVPGVSEINDARAAVQDAQAAAAEAQAEAEVAQAEAEAQIAEAQAAVEAAQTEAEALAAEAQAAEAEALAEAVANAEAEFQAQIEAEIQAEIQAQIEAQIQAQIEAEIQAEIQAEIEAEIQAQIEESLDAGSDEEEFFDTESEFQERLNASTGDDNLFGGSGNTQFSMVQGTSLGGIDVADGGAGTDEISLENLSDFQGRYDVDNQSMDYSFDNSTTPVSGSVLLASVEQLYVDNGTESSVRLNIDGAAAGTFGYVVAGDTGNNTIDVSEGAALSYIGVTSITDANTIGTILFGGGGNDTITGSSAEDVIFGGVGYDTLTGGAGNDSLYGGAGNDTIHGDGVDFIDGGTGTDSLILSNNSDTVTVLGIETITGGSGTDVVSMDGDASTTNYINSISGVELIQAGAGDDSVTFSNATHSTALDGTFETIVGGSGNDTLNLSNNGNTLLDVSGVETINGGSGADTITVTDSTVAAIDGGDGADTITGGSGNDTITGGTGNDILTGGSGTDLFKIDSTSDFSDTITDFSAGAGNDVIDFNATLTHGSANNFESLASGAISSNTAVINFTTDITNYTTESDVASAVSSLSGISANDKLLFAVGNTTDSHLWYWQDANADGIVDDTELLSVAELTGVNNDSLTADNFSGFTVAPILTVASGDTYNLTADIAQSSLVNNGTVNASGTINTPSTVTNNGTLNVTSGSFNSTITNSSGGVINATAGTTVGAAGVSLSNTGTYNAIGSGQVTSNYITNNSGGVIDIASGVVLLAAYNNNPVMSAGSILQGDGEFKTAGNSAWTYNGTWNPGTDGTVGSFTMNVWDANFGRAINMSSSTILNIDIAGTSGGQFDTLAIIGSNNASVIDGILNLKAISGYTPVAGDSFAIFTHSSASTGQFDITHNFGTGWYVIPDYASTTLTVTVQDAAGAVASTAGDDLMISTTGNDTINGAGGTDKFFLHGAQADYTFTFASNGDLTLNDTVGSDGTDTITDVDTLSFTNGDLAISGTNTLTGGSGNDTITLNGSEAVTINGGSGTDTVILDNVNHTLTLSSIENLTGGSLNDTVTFTDTNTTGTIDLGAGDDTLTVKSATVTNGVTIALGADASGDTLILSDSATFSAANLSNVSGIEVLSLANAVNTLTLGSNAATAFGGSSGIIDLATSTSSVQTIDASATGINWTFDISNSSAADILTGGSGDDVISSGTGADTITGGSGADTINLGSGDGAADRVRYTSSTDGASAGSSTGYDSINHFVTGLDEIFIDGGLQTALDDVNINATVDATTGSSNPSLSAAEIAFLTNTVADLTDLTTVASTIGTITAGTGTASDPQNDAIIVLNQTTGTKSGVYLYTHDTGGASTTAVESAELTLLAVVEDANLADGDITFV